MESDLLQQYIAEKLRLPRCDIHVVGSAKDQEAHRGLWDGAQRSKDGITGCPLGPEAPVVLAIDIEGYDHHGEGTWKPMAGAR